MTDLQLFLHRRGVGERDDEVRIWRRADDTFLLHYTEGEHGRTNSQVYSREGVRGYLWTLMYLLTIDSDPFRYVQVTGVGFPSILVSIGELESGSPAWSSVFSILYSFIDGHWSTPLARSSRPVQFRRTGLRGSYNTPRATQQPARSSDSASSSLGSAVPRNSELEEGELRTTEPNSVNLSG